MTEAERRAQILDLCPPKHRHQIGRLLTQWANAIHQQHREARTMIIDDRQAGWDSLAIREILSTLTDDQLNHFCRWNERYNVCDAWEDASRQDCEDYWLRAWTEDPEPIIELVRLRDRFMACTEGGSVRNLAYQ